MRRRLIIIAAAVVALAILWIGIGLGAVSADKKLPEAMSSSEFQVEIHEDTGEVIIYTSVDNLKTIDGYLVVKGEAE